MDLITKRLFRGSGDDYTNELTKEMDNHIDPKNKCKFFSSYLYKHNMRKNGMALRYGGATRGHIEVDDNLVIVKVQLYPDTCFGNIGVYNRSLTEAVQKFIGSKIVFDDKFTSNN